MRTILHILTRPEDEVTRQLIEHQRALSDTTVEVVSLSNPSPDYGQLVEKIFAADTIAVS
jgi:hypothetical protein